MTPEKILRLDDIAFNGKKGLFTGDAKKLANIAVMELDGVIYYANSKATKSSNPAYYNFKGDKEKLVLMKPDGSRRFKTLIIDFDRKYDTEAKLFEFAADICEDSKHHTINMLSERYMCDSCLSVMGQFQERYPNVKVNATSGKRSRAEKMAIIPGNTDSKLRIKDDLTYREYKEEMLGFFCQYEDFGATPEQVTNFLTHEDWNDEMRNTTSAFLWYVAIAVREIELDILEERVRAQISFHIPLYDQGEYHDLEADEKELVDKDVAFIKANVTLIPVDQLKEVED